MMSEKQDTSGLIMALGFDHKCGEAADALITQGGRSVEPLITALTFENWKVRGNAAWTLGNIGDARAVEPLITALKDDVPEVRAIAGSALIKIGKPTIEPLISAMTDGDPRLRRMARSIISRLCDEPVDDVEKHGRCTIKSII